MKKIIVVLILGFFVSSCRSRPSEKPFVITGKEVYNCTCSGFSRYYYVDQNGYSDNFIDSTSFYKVGDLIR